MRDGCLSATGDGEPRVAVAVHLHVVDAHVQRAAHSRQRQDAGLSVVADDRVRDEQMPGGAVVFDAASGETVNLAVLDSDIPSPEDQDAVETGANPVEV